MQKFIGRPLFKKFPSRLSSRASHRTSNKGAPGIPLFATNHTLTRTRPEAQNPPCSKKGSTAQLLPTPADQRSHADPGQSPRPFQDHSGPPTSKLTFLRQASPRGMTRTHHSIVRPKMPNDCVANLSVHGGLFCLSCTACERQGTPKRAQIEEAAIRKMVLTALV